jgi:hypothetical protein
MWFGASIEIGGKGCAKVWMGVGKREWRRTTEPASESGRHIKKSRAQLPVKVVAPLLN